MSEPNLIEDAVAKIKEETKSLNQLEEEARKLHDELCWGNRKDIGVKFPRTPLTREELKKKSKTYHEEKWVKVSVVEAVVAGLQRQLRQLWKERPRLNIFQEAFNAESLLSQYEEYHKAVVSWSVKVEKRVFGEQQAKEG